MTIRIFQNAWFRRFMRREKITEAALIDAINRAECGLIDANLGSGVIKQRIARPGQARVNRPATEQLLFFAKKIERFSFTDLPKVTGKMSMKKKLKHLRKQQRNCYLCQMNKYKP